MIAHTMAVVTVFETSSSEYVSVRKLQKWYNHCINLSENVILTFKCELKRNQVKIGNKYRKKEKKYLAKESGLFTKPDGSL